MEATVAGILCIIQARMNSTRLPGKVLMPLAGKPMLEWVVDAAQESKLIDKVIVATGAHISNKPISEFCNEKGIDLFIGSLDDVLDRFYTVATLLKPMHIVRLTADCPLLTGELIDKVITPYLQDDLSYIQNIYDGLDVEVFPYEELLKAHKLCDNNVDREHVTPYMREHIMPRWIGRARVHRESVKEPFSVNTPEEFKRMEGILGGI